MKKYLTKKEFVFYQILFVLWQLAIYYADIFCYAAPDDPLDMHAEISHINGLNFIRVYFPVVKNMRSNYTAEEQKQILQQYLTYCLLPESDIRPYCGGTSQYDIVEALHVDYAGLDPVSHDAMLFNIVYICDPISFEYARSHQSIPQI